MLYKESLMSIIVNFISFRNFADYAMAGVCLGGTGVYVIFIASSFKDVSIVIIIIIINNPPCIGCVSGTHSADTKDLVAQYRIKLSNRGMLVLANLEHLHRHNQAAKMLY